MTSGTTVCRDRNWMTRPDALLLIPRLNHGPDSCGRPLRRLPGYREDALRSEPQCAGELGPRGRRPSARGEDGPLDGREEGLAPLLIGGSRRAEFHLPFSPGALNARAQVGGAHAVVDELGDHTAVAEQMIGRARVLDARQRL